jgi:hypothetical protein
MRHNLVQAMDLSYFSSAFVIEGWTFASKQHGAGSYATPARLRENTVLRWSQARVTERA